MRRELLERLLLGRERVPGVLFDVRDVQRDVDELPDVLHDVVAAVPVRLDVRDDVPCGLLPVCQVQVLVVLEQLRQLQRHCVELHGVLGRPRADHLVQDVQRVVLDRVHVCEQCVQPVPERLLRVVVHCVLLRCWRDVQRRHQRDGCVHLLDRLQRHQVHDVRERLLLERIAVQHMQHWPVRSAERRVRQRLPERVLRERRFVRGVRLVVRDVPERLVLLVLHHRQQPGVPLQRRVCFDVPVGHVRVEQQHVPCVLQHVRDMLWVVEHVPELQHDGWPALRLEQQHVRDDVPCGPVCERDVLHLVPERDVREVLHCVQLRDRRDVQLWVHRRRLVHVRHGLHSGVDWRCVQHVRERLLPERLDVRCVRFRLQCLQQRGHLHGVHVSASAAAVGLVVRLELLERLLLGRERVPEVLFDVRDVQRRERVPDVLVVVVDAVLQQRQLREPVPRRHLPERNDVQCLLERVRDVRVERDGVHVVPFGPAAEHCGEDVRGDVPDGLLVDGQRVRPVPERLLRRRVHRVLVRRRRDVRRWHHRHGRVQLQQRVLADGGVDELVRQLPASVLPERVVVPQLPERLQRVLGRVDVLLVREPAPASS